MSHHPARARFVGFAALVCSVTFFRWASCGMAADAPAQALPALRQTDVFVSGREGYHTFRIPALLVTPRGTVLAFAEGRKNGRSDTGDIDLVVKRSTDGGRTWSKLAIVWDDADNTCGNPAPVVDAMTGRIWLPMTWNLGRDTEREIVAGTSEETRRPFLTYSDDDGKTWAKPRDLTATAKDPEWNWYATGPANSIQLQRGPHKGRLVVPCDHKLMRDGKEIRRSHVIYSDDHGETWQMSEPLDNGTNESTVVELSDGKLLLNMRSYQGNNRRLVALSSDGGKTWSKAQDDPVLIEPVCQGSILRYTWPEQPGGSRILFSNPASTKREKLTLRLSTDEGRTWAVSRLIYPGSAAYSCLTVLPDGNIGLIYERDNYSKITFGAYSLDAAATE